MKILSRLLFVLFVLLAVLIAVSNSQPVQLMLWPLPQIVVMPLYLLVIGLLMLGVLAGASIGWWASRRHRRRAREHAKEAARMEREVIRLRAAAALQRPAGAAAEPAPREQKAIERQSALVSPDIVQSGTRGPFA